MTTVQSFDDGLAVLRGRQTIAGQGSSMTDVGRAFGTLVKCEATAARRHSVNRTKCGNGGETYPVIATGRAFNSARFMPAVRG